MKNKVKHKIYMSLMIVTLLLGCGIFKKNRVQYVIQKSNLEGTDTIALWTSSFKNLKSSTAKECNLIPKSIETSFWAFGSGFRDDTVSILLNGDVIFKEVISTNESIDRASSLLTIRNSTHQKVLVIINKYTQLDIELSKSHKFITFNRYGENYFDINYSDYFCSLE